MSTGTIISTKINEVPSKNLTRLKHFSLSNSLFLLGLLMTLTLGYVLNILAPETPAKVPDALAAKFLPTLQDLYPKAHDRFMFLSLVIGGFTALSALGIFWANRSRPTPDYPSLFTFCVLMIFGLLLFILIPPELPPVFIAKNFDILCKVFLFSGIIAGLSTINPIRFKSSWFIAIIMVLIVLFTMMTRVFEESLISDNAYLSSHFEAVIYSILHIAGGGTCWADTITQYGCYGEFLAPVLKITGSSILTITAIFATLQSLALLAIIFFATKMIRSKTLLVSAVVTIALLFNFNLYLGSPDHYLQYKPIRLLFPSLSLLWVVVMQQAFSKSNVFYAGLFSGAAIAWNLDTGIVVFASLLFFIFLLSFPKEKITFPKDLKYPCKQFFYYLSGTIIFLTFFSLYLVHKSHWTVDILAPFTYQREFYLSGIKMLPIPPFLHYGLFLP